MGAKSVLIVVAMLACAGCSAMGERKALYTERILAAAGFQMKFAANSDQEQAIAAMPQRKIVPVPYEGKTRYTYADAAYCKCMYAGSEAAWERAQKIAVESKLVSENSAASLQWDMWGAWGPWW